MDVYTELMSWHPMTPQERARLLRPPVVRFLQPEKREISEKYSFAEPQTGQVKRTAKMAGMITSDPEETPLEERYNFAQIEEKRRPAAEERYQFAKLGILHDGYAFPVYAGHSNED